MEVSYVILVHLLPVYSWAVCGVGVGLMLEITPRRTGICDGSLTAMEKHMIVIQVAKKAEVRVL